MKSSLIVVLCLIVFACDAQSLVDVKSEIVQMLNEYRGARLLSPLKYDSSHQRDIDAWAKQLPRNYKHAPLRYSGETIGVFYATANDVVQGFKDSPGHWHILMARDASRICLAVFMVPSTHVVEVKGDVTTSIFTVDRFFAVIRTYDGNYSKSVNAAGKRKSNSAPSKRRTRSFITGISARR